MTATAQIDPILAGVLSQVLEIPVTDVSEDLSSSTCDNWTSAAHVSVILATEEAFGVKFDEAAIPDLASYVDLKQAVAEKLGGN